MHFDKLKNLVKQNGDKFILVENGEPEIVMMSFHEYQKLANHNANTANLHMDVTNREDDNYYMDVSAGRLSETEFVSPHELEAPGLPVRLEDIRLDDLPI